MKRIVSILACLAFLAFAGYRIPTTYGSQWQLGRYCMPEILLAPDGEHYRDGQMVDAVNLAIARSGYEQELWLGFLAVLVLIVVGAWLGLSRMAKKIEQRQAGAMGR